MFPIQDTIRTRSFPIITWLLIIANIAVFVLAELPLQGGALERFVYTYALIPARLVNAEPWAFVTIFTSMFLHGGWLHLISNMWALFIFGDNVEDQMGLVRYLAFYLLGGVVAAVTQVVIDPNSNVPMIGASGAIAGVLGAYLVQFPKARVTTLIPIFFIPWFVEIPAIIYLLIWFATQFLSGVLALDMGTIGGVAYWAHIGGFVFGLLLVKAFVRRVRRVHQTHRAYYSHIPHANYY